jgi:hypothetical protein
MCIELILDAFKQFLPRIFFRVFAFAVWLCVFCFVLFETESYYVSPGKPQTLDHSALAS